MITQRKDFPESVLAFTCSGHVSKADYDAVLVPAVEAAFKKSQTLRLYYETAADFNGIEPGAFWADFKVGMEHLRGWERVAVVTDVESQGVAPFAP